MPTSGSIITSLFILMSDRMEPAQRPTASSHPLATTIGMKPMGSSISITSGCLATNVITILSGDRCTSSPLTATAASRMGGQAPPSRPYGCRLNSRLLLRPGTWCTCTIRLILPDLSTVRRRSCSGLIKPGEPMLSYPAMIMNMSELCSMAFPTLWMAWEALPSTPSQRRCQAVRCAITAIMAQCWSKPAYLTSLSNSSRVPAWSSIHIRLAQ